MDFESIMQIGICLIVGVFVGRVTYRLLLYCPKRHRRLEKEDYCSRARQEEGLPAEAGGGEGGEVMSGYVYPSKLGDRELYCYACGQPVVNTANHEMRKEGYYAHSHSCCSDASRVMVACPITDETTDCTAVSRVEDPRDCRIFDGKCRKGLLRNARY